tara:strand:- start:2660 stop:2935 length:276 start_codon:yes stop_codon:yes gene_type:complete
MALTTSLDETNIGIPVANTYARIVMMHCERDTTDLFVAYYANSDARNADAMPVFERPFRLPTSELEAGDNPLAIGYAWLKTQPEFAEAEDV